MANSNLYASREGMLYQSYDNYAGASGFYDPSQDQQPQQTGSATPVTAASPPKFPVPAPPGGVMQPAQYQQATFAQFYQEQPTAYQPATVAAYPQQYAAQQNMYASFSSPVQPVQTAPVQYYQNTATTGAGTVQVMNMPQYMPQGPPLQPVAPVAYGAQLRGVGIKFGERIDPRSGGMLVYVKRLVKGGPADQAQRIQPGDVLQLINGEDIYGQGLDILRDKIPGPAGTTVKLGFRSYAGQLYEVDLARTAYGDQPEAAAQPLAAGAQYMYAPQVQPVSQPQMVVTMPPSGNQAHQQYVAQVPQQTQYVMAPRQQYVQQPAVQYVQAPQYRQQQYMQQQPVQYVAAPRQQVQYQPAPYQQQQQYVQPQPMPQQQPYQPQQQQYQYQPQPMEHQYQPQPQYQYAQQPQQQPQYAQQYAQPQSQQDYVQPLSQQQYGQPQSQQPVYGDYDNQGDYQGQYGDEHLQGTQV